MKKSIKAALMSALVFPGAGHFLLNRAGRGCLFLLPAAAAAAYIAGQVMERANAIVAQIESGALPLDPQLIIERISAAPGAEGPQMTLAVVVALLCWAGSIIDALLIGDPA
jgi:TM2 domain-containing membrane protein YozV